MTWYEWFAATLIYAIWSPFGGIYYTFIAYLPVTEYTDSLFFAEVRQPTNVSQPKFLPIIIKLCICLAVLIVIRGGVPRFRYDLLTKLGWTKFLLYVLAFFLMTLCIYLI